MVKNDVQNLWDLPLSNTLSLSLSLALSLSLFLSYLPHLAGFPPRRFSIDVIKLLYLQWTMHVDWGYGYHWDRPAQGDIHRDFQAAIRIRRSHIDNNLANHQISKVWRQKDFSRDSGGAHPGLRAWTFWSAESRHWNLLFAQRVLFVQVNCIFKMHTTTAPVVHHDAL